MNFARHQAQADRTARRLIWLHALASLAVVIGINAAAALIWQLLFGAAPYPKGFFLTCLRLRTISPHTQPHGLTNRFLYVQAYVKAYFSSSEYLF